jgi:hypothetical protein
MVILNKVEETLPLNVKVERFGLFFNIFLSFFHGQGLKGYVRKKGNK